MLQESMSTAVWDGERSVLPSEVISMRIDRYSGKSQDNDRLVKARMEGKV